MLSQFETGKWLAFATLFFGLTTIASSQTSSNESLQKFHHQELNKWMLRAYEGDVEAQFSTAILFTNTQASKPDYSQAVYWYTQAAKQGHILAQYNLGHLYLTGTGVEQNNLKAIHWWQKAGAQEHALAQFNLGRAYYLGIGVTPDPRKARDWLERAANNKEPKSIEILQTLGWTTTQQNPDSK